MQSTSFPSVPQRGLLPGREAGEVLSPAERVVLASAPARPVAEHWSPRTSAEILRFELRWLLVLLVILLVVA